MDEGRKPGRGGVAVRTSIPITKPLFGDEELRAVQRPLESGWVVQGPYVAEFEQRFGAFTGSPFSVATSSCTTALHVAIAALGLSAGDEVIVPAFTWVSTANVVEYMGATPVFCDIDLETFNIDPAQIEPLITPKTAGIIPVHLFGLPADMDPILELARKHALWVLEDAACSLGGWYKGRHTGTLGDAGAFSFHPRKSITTGEGGMVTTAREDLDGLVRSLRDHGASRSDFDRHGGKAGFLLSEYNHLGYNVRMTDIQGALGCAQMDRLEGILAQRSRLARAYDDALSDLEWLRAPRVPDGSVHGYQAYVTLFSPVQPSLSNVARLQERRDALMLTLEEKGIATRQGTHAAALTGYYSQRYGLQSENYPLSYLAEQLTLTLPLYPQLGDDEQATVISELQAAL